jgi:hypothetical protein
MKQQVSKQSLGTVFASRCGWCLITALLLGGTLHGLGQGRKKDAPPKEPLLPGYLSKSPPSSLRFAAPPKPPVAYLPPLPITYDPQPVFSPEFAQPNAPFPVSVSTPPTPLPPAPTSLQWPEAASKMTNKVQIPATPVDMGAVSPQMLVRFFQNGKPADVQMLMTDTVSFRVPVKEEKQSSSASYEVK